MKKTAFLVFCLLTVNLFYQSNSYGQNAKEGTQLAHTGISTVIWELTKSIEQYNAMDFLKLIFNPEALKEPENILKSYDIYEKMTNEGEVVESLNEVMSTFMPEGEEIDELASLKYEKLNEYKERYQEIKGEQFSKTNESLKNMFGLSLSEYSKVKKETTEEERKKYFEALVSTCHEDKGANCLSGVQIEQTNALLEVQYDSLGQLSHLSNTIAKEYRNQNFDSQLAQKHHERATNVQGWDEAVKIKDRTISPHWRDNN